MTDAFRTPEDRFADLPGFAFEPHYREVDGLRLAHIDEGEGAPVIFVHGEPTWSFLWRKVIPPVLDAGFRCLAPDPPGSGARTSRPTSAGTPTTATCEALRGCSASDFRDATVVVPRLGRPDRAAAAVEHPDRITRLVIMDTGLFTGHEPMTDAWKTFRDFVQRTEDLPIEMLVRRPCRPRPPPTTSLRPTRPRSLPGVEGRCPGVPADAADDPRDARGAAGKKVLEAMRTDERRR